MSFVDFAPGCGPEPTIEQETAQAAVRAPSIGSPAAVTSPFTSTARDITNFLDEGWDREGVCWEPVACLKTECDETVCEPCAPPTIVKENLADWPTLNGLVNADPFTYGTKFRHNDCQQPGITARQIVDVSAGKNLARGLHKRLQAIGTPVNDNKCTCAATAVGLLEQGWEANQTGEPWFSVPSMLKGHLKQAGLLEKAGARWFLCGQPALVGGMGPGGPTGSDPVTDCAYLWIHGPVDYALGSYRDKSFRHDTKNLGFQNVRRKAIVRVDPCGVGAVPVSLKCGGC